MDNDVKDIVNRRHIGRNIQKIRVYLGMKQEALAADLGVSQNVISKIEKESELRNRPCRRFALLYDNTRKNAKLLPMKKEKGRIRAESMVY